MTERKKTKIAWSDDISYDSEEEREKERIALAELAEIETPEKPSYSDEELDKLVTYVQQLTTLYCLRKEDWNVDCVNVIKDFFMEPKCLLLTVFFHNNILYAMLSIPELPVYDLTYFSREPEMIFTVDNFHDEIIFGTFVESVEESLLKMLEYVYAPVFFAASDWPDGVKSEFCTHLHTFLAKSTDLHYKMLGLTKIYIPREGLNLSVEEASSNRDLVKRLESVVVHWTHQMKSCIEDHDTAETQRELVCPPDEYEFWVYRYENLNSVIYQIKNDSVKHISKILTNTHSSYIKQFQKLCDQLTECMVEAKSNIEYLQIIVEPCMAMDAANDLNELPQYISKILNTFRYIWLQSPYYNTPSRLTNLCNSLSNQVILQCSESIDLKALFSGKTRAAMEEFRKCIECCKTYREIYDSVAEAHNELAPGSWNLDTTIIFNYIDSFVQRCVDMLEVCNCMILFGRIDEIEEIPIPRFGGTKGEDFEKICEKVERSFRYALLEIEKAQDSILDVQATSWYANVIEFNATTKHIEVLIENLISSIFETINNVEEGVQVLCSMYNYSKRINLHRIFQQKTSEVWTMFSKEIGYIKQELVAERSRFPASMPSYSGRALMAHMRDNRLIYLKKVMHSAAWMLPCSNAEDTLKQQKKLMQAIEILIENMWSSWTRTENADIILRLDKSLLCESSHQELIECNIDRIVMKTCCEARHWQYIDWEIPPHFTKLYSKLADIRYTYENMLILIQGYNRILISLSNDERKLFKPLINTCLKTIKPGLKKLQWTSPNLDAYTINCKKNIKELQDFLDCYKLCNQHIVMLLENICDTPLLEFKIFNVFDLEDLKIELKRIWDTTIVKLLEMYKQIVTYLIIIYEGFENYIEEVPVYWVNYVSKYDMLLENAFLLNVKTSMQNMLSNVSGDGTVAPQPLLNMKTVLENSEICYVPSHADVLTTLSSILSSLVGLMHEIPRLLEKFGLPTDFKNFGVIIANDSECQNLNDLIIEETENALEMVLIDTKSWDSFKHIWEVSKDEFLDNYVLHNPTARDFDKDITRYGDLGNDVQMQDNISQVHFIILNYLSLKVSVDEHCGEWQTKFENKLKGMTQKNINAVYKYIKTSSEAAMRHPSNLVEFQELIESYEKLCSEILQTEKRISTMKDQMDVLGE